MITIRKLLLFTWNQALCCIFPIVIFSAMAVTKVVEIPKVNMGSWSYPEDGWTKFGGVPLYSGFMYASVSSYICQAWRRFDLKFERWPKGLLTTALAVLIYLNFFTHHYFWDMRWALSASLLLLFPRTSVWFKVDGKPFLMHILLSFLLIAFFIWIAENISTFLGAWKYPDQQLRWNVVHWGKFSSWFLLIIISIIIVVQLKNLKTWLWRNQTKGTVSKVNRF